MDWFCRKVHFCVTIHFQRGTFRFKHCKMCFCGIKCNQLCSIKTKGLCLWRLYEDVCLCWWFSSNWISGIRQVCKVVIIINVNTHVIVILLVVKLKSASCLEGSINLNDIMTVLESNTTEAFRIFEPLHFYIFTLRVQTQR